jgi:ankyrin repeat protein
VLLDKGADVNAQGGKFGNALYAASAEGHEQVVKLLLDKGADVNAQGRNLSNARQVASARGYRQVVKMLLDKGANVNVRGGPLRQRTASGFSWRLQADSRDAARRGCSMNSR